MAIPGLPGGFFSSTRETHLFPPRGHLWFRVPGLSHHSNSEGKSLDEFGATSNLEGTGAPVGEF